MKILITTPHEGWVNFSDYPKEWIPIEKPKEDIKQELKQSTLFD